jgi:hypothetical protein
MTRNMNTVGGMLGLKSHTGENVRLPRGASPVVVYGHKVDTKQGTVTIGASAVSVPRNRVIRNEDIVSVSVGGNDKKYMTGKRAAGVLATGGIALLAPTRVRGNLVIGTVTGEILSFTLKGKDARNPAAVAMAFGLAGVEVI